jgi:hypothetical protein
MKTIYVRFLAAFFGMAAFAAAARAQEIDQIIVNVPYEFVAAGKTLPAGTYRVHRAYDDRGTKVLIMTSFENREGVLLLSSDVSTTRELKPAVTFEHIGDQYFLSKIETADHIFTYPVSTKAATQVLAMRKQTIPAASSSSGSN